MFPVEYALIFIAIIILAMFVASLKAMFLNPIKYRVSRSRYPNKRPAYCMKRQQHGFHCEQRGWVRTYPTLRGGKDRLRDTRNGWGM